MRRSYDQNEQLEAIVAEAMMGVPDVTSWLIALREGLLFALHGGFVDAEALGARCANLEALVEELLKGEARAGAEALVVVTAGGYLVIRALGANNLLCVLTRANANLGLVLLELERLALRMAPAAAQAPPPIAPDEAATEPA